MSTALRHRLTLRRSEVAAWTGVSLDLVDEMIADGTLRSKVVRGRRLIDRESVETVFGFEEPAPPSVRVLEIVRDVRRGA